MFYKKRAQASSTAALLALLAVFILLYMLLIPPDLRQDLLGNDQGTDQNPSTDSPTSFTYNKTVLDVTPGRIDYLKFSEYEHPLPSVNLYSTTTSKELDIGDSVYVKNGIFDRKIANLSFSVDDPENMDNVLLSFKLNPNRNNKGMLTIKLNGHSILNKELGTSQNEPIKITSLDKHNTLSFEVSGVGYRFWTTNEYELEDLKLFYDLTDISTQESKNVFMVTDSEKFNLDKVSLKFFPDCQPSTAGKLNVYINNMQVFSSVPDCGQLNMVDFSPSVIESGNNRVVFGSDHGRYLIDQIMITTEMKAMTYPVYYFDLDNRFFTKSTTDNDEEDVCGEIDGVCPKGCDPDLDKDCCLQETSGYWCDYQPANQDDRCRAVTSEAACSLCPSGYEDSKGNPPEKCEDMCGDDTDNDCPAGCSKYYDEDCCYDEDSENFWCSDIPKFGLATCKDAITTDECDACYSGWKSEDSDFTCPSTENDGESVLSSSYDVKLTLKFIDDNEKKAGNIFINGYQFYFYTYGDEYSRNINNYVEDGTNAIKVEPDQTVLDIRKMIIEIDE